MRGDRFLQHFRMLNMGVLRVFTKVTVFAAATQRVLGGDNLLHTHPPWKRTASWHWTKCSFENARPWRVYRNQAGLLEMALNRIISKVSRQKHEALTGHTSVQVSGKAVGCLQPAPECSCWPYFQKRMVSLRVGGHTKRSLHNVSSQRHRFLKFQRLVPIRCGRISIGQKGSKVSCMTSVLGALDGFRLSPTKQLFASTMSFPRRKND